MRCDGLTSGKLWACVYERDKYLLGVEDLATYIFVDIIQERVFYNSR
jgi:hypothetical protein